MNPANDLGWCACTLMLVAFCCTRAVWLRSFSIAANLAFIGYGWFGDIAPVMALHLVLLPVNVMRLAQAVAELKRGARDRAPAAASPPVANALVGTSIRLAISTMRGLRWIRPE